MMHAATILTLEKKQLNNNNAVLIRATTTARSHLK